MKIATARKKTSKHWRVQDTTWEQFLQRIRTPLRTGETLKEYAAMSKEDRDLAKEAAGGYVLGDLRNGQRKTESVVSRSAVTLDADNAVPNMWDNVTLLCGFRMACYATHSSTADKPRLRWVIPTDRPMTPDEYPAVARRLASWIGIETMDPSTYELARLMYWPTICRDASYEYHEQDGEVLKVDEVLRLYGDDDEWRDVWRWPVAQGEQDIRRSSQAKAGDPTEKGGIVGLFCRTYSVYDVLEQFLPDVYEPTIAPDRYTYTQGSTAGGAIVYNDGAFLYSNHATDPCQGRSVNAFDLVRIHKYGAMDDTEEDVPVTKLPSYRAMCEWASGLPEVRVQMGEERQAELMDAFSDLTETAVEAEAEGNGGAGCNDNVTQSETGGEKAQKRDTDTKWMEKLSLESKGKGGGGRVEQTTENALLILLNDSNLKGAFGYDLFKDRPMRLKRLPWRSAADAKGEWLDVDDSGLRLYMESKWGYDARNKLQDAVEIAMRKNAFHPVQKYLKGLKWDGIERLDTLFPDYYGTEDTMITRAVTRKFFCGAAKRVLQPGCKFDNMLVLVGNQNAGKSEFVKLLSKGWMNDSKVDMNSKEGYDALHGAWLVELAELACTRKTDVEIVKTFISKREDTYRSAYARRTETHPRQCAFIGTTNEAEFLRDRTGNRRFWPISIEKQADLGALEKVVDQVWAEALVRLDAGESLWLDTKEQQDAMAEIHAYRMISDEMDSLLDEFLDTPITNNWYDLTVEDRKRIAGGYVTQGEVRLDAMRNRVCVSEIRVEMLGEDRKPGAGNDMMSRRIANLMNTKPGWKKMPQKVRVKGYGAQWVYLRELPDWAS